MGHFEERFWEGRFDPALPRRERRGGRYCVYIPDRLAGISFSFDSDVAADVSDAERAITAFDTASLSLADTEALARLLLRAESVASSKIEGFGIGARRLLRADALRGPEGQTDEMAAEVLGNIDAMAYAVQAVPVGGTIDADVLLETHKRLLKDTALGEHYAGRFRNEQNWIGGNDFNPIDAAFVPPAPEMIEELIQDLCEFCNDDSLPVVAQTAIAHAQFETIHPFVDGNGRVGRALIQMIFRARGLTRRTNIPVSLILATRSRDYVKALSTTRYEGQPTSPEARSAYSGWIETFAAACTAATEQAAAFEQKIRSIQSEWRERLQSLGIRSDSSAFRLIDVLPGAPVLTMQTAQTLSGATLRGTMNGMERLLETKIVTAVNDRRQRKRIFEVREIIDAFTVLERQLASPDGDTRISRPARLVPSRPLS